MSFVGDDSDVAIQLTKPGDPLPGDASPNAPIIAHQSAGSIHVSGGRQTTDLVLVAGMELFQVGVKQACDSGPLRLQLPTVANQHPQLFHCTIRTNRWQQCFAQGDACDQQSVDGIRPAVVALTASHLGGELGWNLHDLQLDLSQA